MKTEQEVEEMKSEIQRKIEMLEVKMLSASGEFEFNALRDEKIRKVAQYNIILEVLK